MSKPPPSPAFVARVQRSVRERARRRGLHVGFGEGRRTSDVSLVVVKGERIDVLRHVPDIFAGLDLDQEVVRSCQTPEDFEIVVALMRPKRQRGRVSYERRASELGDDAA
jgi:hypothetical protein